MADATRGLRPVTRPRAARAEELSSGLSERQIRTHSRAARRQRRRFGASEGRNEGGDKSVQQKILAVTIR